MTIAEIQDGEYETIMSESLISLDTLALLWKHLLRIPRERKKEIDFIAKNFGDPVSLSRQYVQSDCQHDNPADFVGALGAGTSVVRQNVFITISQFFSGDSFLESDGRNCLFVLADAGMGKTSLLIMLKLYQISGFWRKNETMHLIKIGPSTLNEISTIEAPQRTVLLLDSLDEDPEALVDIVSRLQSILEKLSKFRRIIITCRTQFFPDHDSGDFRTGRVSVVGYTCPMVFLSYFSEAQVSEYLEKRFPNHLYNKLLRRPNVERLEAEHVVARMSDLAFRPILISRIKDIIDSTIATENWTPLLIHEAIVRTWLKREVNKMRSRGDRDISASKLRFSCEKIAVYMRSKLISEIPEHELEKVLEPGSQELMAINAVDIGGRSLMNRNSVGNFRFAHYTIMEFLCITGVVLSNVRYTESILMSDMMASFLTEMVSAKEKRQGRLSRPFSRVLKLTGLRFGAIKWSARLSNEDLHGVQFIRSEMTGVIFSNCDLSNCIFTSVNLSCAIFSNCDLTGSVFSDGNLSFSCFRDCSMSGAMFKGVNLFGCDMLSKGKLRILEPQFQSESPFIWVYPGFPKDFPSKNQAVRLRMDESRTYPPFVHGAACL